MRRGEKRKAPELGSDLQPSQPFKAVIRDKVNTLVNPRPICDTNYNINLKIVRKKQPCFVQLSETKNKSRTSEMSPSHLCSKGSIGTCRHSNARLQDKIQLLSRLSPDLDRELLEDYGIVAEIWQHTD